MPLHPARNNDLHGYVPDHSDVALLLIDVINDLSFEGSEALVRQASPMARRLAKLKRRAEEAKVPVVFVNDNFGRWRSDLHALITHCLEKDMPGKPIVELLQPGAADYFVLKPKHSGFFSTTLDTLLAYLCVQTLILTGVAGNICVLFTANDAYMRDFNLVVPADCVASNSEDENRYALEQMREVLKADIRPSVDIDFSRLQRRSPRPFASGDDATRPRSGRQQDGVVTS